MEGSLGEPQEESLHNLENPNLMTHGFQDPSASFCSCSNADSLQFGIWGVALVTVDASVQ